MSSFGRSSKAVSRRSMSPSIADFATHPDSAGGVTASLSLPGMTPWILNVASDCTTTGRAVPVEAGDSIGAGHGQANPFEIRSRVGSSVKEADLSADRQGRLQSNRDAAEIFTRHGDVSRTPLDGRARRSRCRGGRTRAEPKLTRRDAWEGERPIGKRCERAGLRASTSHRRGAIRAPPRHRLWAVHLLQ